MTQILFTVSVPIRGFFVLLAMVEKYREQLGIPRFSPHQGIFCFVGYLLFGYANGGKSMFQSPSGDFLFCWGIISPKNSPLRRVVSVPIRGFFVLLVAVLT